MDISEIKVIWNNRSAEENFLSCIFIDNDILLITTVKNTYFYSKELWDIYKIMVWLYKDKKRIDTITVASLYTNDDLLFDISTKVYSASNWQVFEDEIKNNFYKRMIEDTNNKIKSLLYDNKSISEIQWLAKKILDVVDVWNAGENTTEIFMDIIDNIGKKEQYICQYWYQKLDAVLWWYIEGNLVIVAARPWVWKTAFAIELLQRIVKQGKKPAIYSLEMTNKEIAKRFIANWTNISIRHLDKTEHQQKISDTVINKVWWWFEYISHDKIRKYSDIESSIRREVLLNGCDIVFIDHIGLVKWDKFDMKNRNDWIGYVTSWLKELAKELWISIVWLSQLNRSLHGEPELENLRDSGNIEQDADIVMMLHREQDSEWHMDQDNMYNYIRKNRNGKVWWIRMESKLQYMQITEAI